MIKCIILCVGFYIIFSWDIDLTYKLTEKEIQDKKISAMCWKIILFITLAIFVCNTEYLKTDEEIHDDKKGSQPRNTRLLYDDRDIIAVKYELDTSNILDDGGLVVLEDAICRSLKYYSYDKERLGVLIQVYYPDGYFVYQDKYGNRTYSKSEMAISGKWNIQDINRYNCDNNPDVFQTVSDFDVHHYKFGSAILRLVIDSPELSEKHSVMKLYLKHKKKT